LGGDFGDTGPQCEGKILKEEDQRKTHGECDDWSCESWGTKEKERKKAFYKNYPKKKKTTQQWDVKKKHALGGLVNSDTDIRTGRSSASNRQETETASSRPEGLPFEAGELKKGQKRTAREKKKTKEKGNLWSREGWYSRIYGGHRHLGEAPSQRTCPQDRDIKKKRWGG